MTVHLQREDSWIFMCCDHWQPFPRGSGMLECAARFCSINRHGTSELLACIWMTLLPRIGYKVLWPRGAFSDQQRKTPEGAKPRHREEACRSWINDLALFLFLSLFPLIPLPKLEQEHLKKWCREKQPRSTSLKLALCKPPPSVVTIQGGHGHQLPPSLGVQS